MASGGIRQAEEAVLDALRESGKPEAPTEMMTTIAAKSSVHNALLRAAIWQLIGRGEIELTDDRRLRLRKETPPQPVH